ncbi:MAG: SirB2 family protein [Bacteroidia bacterium]|nr:SirB2 family protein [Bacteroidota bacterium]MBP6641367.1 SirB2 family protein [Bacteroidia bacterium]
MDTGILHSHTLVVSLYLLQLLIRVVLMAAASKEALAKYTKAMRIPHIVLATLMLGTGIFLMVRQAQGVDGIQPYVWVKFALVLASIPLGVVGSKRNSVALTGFAFVVLAGCMALAYAKPEALRSVATKAIDTEKAGVDMEKVKAGQPLYEKYCVLCHGSDGAAGIQGAKNLQVSVLVDADILSIIKNGKGMMPANPDLNDAQVEQVKEYVKYLRK